MSRQSEAKKQQGYNPKPLVWCCRNCASLVSVWSSPDPKYPNRKTEKLTCGYKTAIWICDGFAVKARGVCIDFNLLVGEAV